METEIPMICHLQAGDPRKLVVQIPVWVQRPGKQDYLQCNSLSKSRRALMSQLQQSGGEKENSTFFHLFVVFRPSTDWMMHIYTGEGHLLYSIHQFKYLNNLF